MGRGKIKLLLQKKNNSEAKTSGLSRKGKKTRMNISLWARTALSLQKRRIYQNSLKGFQSRRFLSTGHDVFLQGNSGNYVEEMYQSWKTDPSSVHVSWQQYFKQLDAGVPSNKAFYAPPNLISGADIAPREAAEPYSMEESAGAISDHLKVQLLIRSYQVRGHRLANLDPLSLNNTEKSFKKELDYRKYGFVESDLDKTFQLGPGMLPGFLSRGYTSMTLREIVKNLEDIYCTLSFSIANHSQLKQVAPLVWNIPTYLIEISAVGCGNV